MPYKQRVGGSIPSLDTICGCSTTARAPAFQAGDAGSIPEDSKSSGSDTVWVQVPPSAPRRICIKSQPRTIFSVLMVTRPSASTGMRGLQSRSTSDVSHANRIWQYDWRWLQHDLIRRKTQVRVLLLPPQLSQFGRKDIINSGGLMRGALINGADMHYR